MLFGIALALGSAITHASWNTLVKCVSAGGRPALWAYSVAGTAVVVLAIAVAAALGHRSHLSTELLGLAAVSTVLHTAYAAAVQQAYRHFDVSQIYPVSRGLAPVCVALVGIVVLHQTLSALSWTGVLLMGLAVATLFITRSPTSTPVPGRRRPATWAAAIAALIAAYTTFDGWAVVGEHVDPLTYYGLGATLQLGLITALVGRRIAEGIHQLRQHSRAITLLAVLIPGSYLLGLYATQHISVALVAALRSTSLIWAAAAASIYLREPVDRTRLATAALAVTALIAMAIGQVA